MSETTLRPLRPLMSRSMPAAPLSIGELSELRFLPLAKLVVDDRYQRSIADRGHSNISRILAGFDWRKFTPVVVTPIADDLFAIIDGQHRATAALMHPAIEAVPCMIIQVTPEEAAACFAAINGQVTAITKGQLFYARVAAGEAAAVALQAVIDAAEVTVLRYKAPGQPYRVGETFALGTLEECLRLYGRETLITALQSITQAGDGNPGCLIAGLIKALCMVLHEVGAWRNAGGRLLAAMDEIDLFDFVGECKAQASRTRMPTAKVMTERLAAHLLRTLGEGAAT